jgi:hypothetical protein
MASRDPRTMSTLSRCSTRAIAADDGAARAAGLDALLSKARTEATPG